MISIKPGCVSGAFLLAIALPSSGAFVFPFPRGVARISTHSRAKLESAEGDALLPSRDIVVDQPDCDGCGRVTSRRGFLTAAVSMSGTLFAVETAQAIGLPSLPPLPFSSADDAKSETATEVKSVEPAVAAGTEKDGSNADAAVTTTDDESAVRASTADAEASPRPPDSARVLVLGGTGTIGREIMTKLAALGTFAIATSRDGRDGTIALDVLDKKTGTIDAVTQLADENKATAVISCIGAVRDPSSVGLVNGASGLAAIGSRNATSVRRFVLLGVSPAVSKSDGDLEGYFAGKAFSEECATAQFKGEGYSYTIVRPSAMLDPGVVADAAIAGALGYDEGVLDTNDKIARAAKRTVAPNETRTGS